MARLPLVCLVLVVGCGSVVQATDAAGDDEADARRTPDASCPDGDGDGVCDAADACPGFDDTANADGDVLPDGCNPCPTDPSPTCMPVTCTVRFDDAWMTEAADQGKSPEMVYGPLGIHFGIGAGFGLIGGQSNGDPGNWDIEGSNGPAAWGLWPSDHSISWPTPVTMVQIDFLRGFADYSQTAGGLLLAVQIDTQTVVVAGAFQHTTMTFAGPIDAVAWTEVEYYGVDNIRFTTTTTSGITCPP